jgi:hypothetical protein
MEDSVLSFLNVVTVLTVIALCAIVYRTLASDE